MRFIIFQLAILAVFLAAKSATADEISTAKRYETLLKQYEEEGGSRIFAKKFLALAEQRPQDTASADALLWVVKKVRGKADTDRALELLLKHHVRSEKLGLGCKTIGRSRSVGGEKLLRELLTKNPNKQVQAHACFYLATLLDQEAVIAEQLKSNPELAPRVLQYYGPKYGQHLASLKPVELEKQRDQVYALMLKSYGSATVEETKLSEIATKELFALRHLSVGKLAPEITGQDIHGKPMKLSGFRGKVVMLTFWGHW
jgi:hypothetical protein